MLTPSSIEVSFSGFGNIEPGEKNRVIYRIDLGEKNYEVFFSSPDVELRPNVEVALPLALLAAMRLARPIHVKGAVSRGFIDGARQVVELFARSFDELSQIDISADEYLDCPQEITEKRVGCFFSGGVDSFYTLLKMRDEITDLVVVHGFDFQAADTHRSSAVSKNVHAVADSFGIRVFEITCNPHQVLEDFGEWGRHGHGFALIAVGRTLSDHLDSIVVPGSFSLAQQKPWGSWIESDPLFSDSLLSVTHHADNSERIDKTIYIANDPLVQKYLRVCWKNVAGAYNCGECEKCLRTMTSLEILGVRNKFETFPQKWSPAMVAAIEHDRPGVKLFAKENLQCMQRLEYKNLALRLALLLQLHRPVLFVKFKNKWRRRLKRIRRHLGRIRQGKMS